MADVLRTLSAAADEPYVRLHGCPVSVAEQVLALVHLGKTKNPYFSANEIVEFNRAYLGWRAATALKRLGGERYQKRGPTTRGEARVD
jgi:hypothetical protein